MSHKAGIDIIISSYFFVGRRTQGFCVQLKPAVSIRITKNRIDNNWKLWCGESDLDGRKHFGIFSFNFWITVNLVTGNKWLAE